MHELEVKTVLLKKRLNFRCIINALIRAITVKRTDSEKHGIIIFHHLLEK